MSSTSTALPLYALLTVHGARTRDFLQGQLTCDMREASAERVLSGAWCTVKGRVVASMLVWAESGERVWLRLRSDLAAGTAQAMQRYAALSRVKLEPGELACIGVLGEDAREQLAARLGACPREGLQACRVDEAVLVQRDKNGELYELWVPSQSVDAWLARLALPAGSEQAWRLALIRRSLAEVQAATRESFLPQMLDYDSDGTVNFRKGCYTGQEIVARTHYKGSVKRRLVLLEGDTGECPAPGSELRDANRAAGNVVDSASDGPGRCAVLAVLAEESSAAEPALWHTHSGVVLRAVR